MSENAPKRKRSPWFAFYPDDFSGGTRSMSLAARGAFIELLSFQFANGSIPADDTTICRIIGAFPKEWRAIKGEVLAKFEIADNGNFVNERMTKERAERDGIREKRVQAITKRWSKTDTNVLQMYPVCNDFVGDLVYTSTSTSTTIENIEGDKSPSHSPSRKKVSGVDLDSIASRIADLVPKWSRHLNGDERAAIYENQAKWADLTEDDWSLLSRWYSDTSPRSQYRTQRKAKLIAEVDQELGKAAKVLNEPSTAKREF